jgi:hypothetical protein
MGVEELDVVDVAALERFRDDRPKRRQESSLD